MSIFAKVNDSVGSVLESVVENCNTIETLEEGVFNYKPSMIPVAARETGEGTKYIVEFDMLQKLAGYENSSITEAFEAVCMENCIDAEDVYVFVSEGTCNLISESYVNDYDTGTIMSIDNGIKSLAEAGVNMLMAEGVNYKFFKFEKLATEHPELSSIKDDLKNLNKFSTTDGDTLYKNRKSVLKTCTKILRVLYALNTNINLIAGPLLGFTPWISAAVGKILISSIDKAELGDIAADAQEVIEKLDKIKANVKDEKVKDDIERRVNDLREKLNNARKEDDE